MPVKELFRLHALVVGEKREEVKRENLCSPWQSLQTLTFYFIKTYLHKKSCGGFRLETDSRAELYSSLISDMQCRLINLPQIVHGVRC